MQITITNPTISAALDNNAIANQIVANLSIPEFTPLERYAIANQLLGAARLAANILSDDALKFALREPNAQNPEPNPLLPITSVGGEFEHEGHFYSVKYERSGYNFGGQKVEGKSDPISVSWKQAVALSNEYAQKAAAQDKLRKGYEAVLLTNHKLVPTTTKTTLSFMADKSRKNGTA